MDVMLEMIRLVAQLEIETVFALVGVTQQLRGVGRVPVARRFGDEDVDVEEQSESRRADKLVDFVPILARHRDVAILPLFPVLVFPSPVSSSPQVFSL